MNETTLIKTRIADLKAYNWLSYRDGDNVVVICDDVDTITEAARRWGMSREAVRALNNAFNSLASELINALSEDLQDLWKHRADQQITASDASVI